MKSLVAMLVLTTALTFPGLALARPVTLTTTLNDYGATAPIWRSMSPGPSEPTRARCGWPAAGRNTTATSVAGCGNRAAI